MFFRFNYCLVITAFVFVSVTLFQGCNENDPVIPASEHFEPEGWLIRDATQKPIIVIWQGVIQSSWNSQLLDTVFKVPLNALSDHLTVKFLDAGRNIINPPTNAYNHFGWSISDTTKLAIVRDSPTDWAFHLKGKQIGTTSIELQVRHTSHVDVRTPLIPVSIDVDTSAHGEPLGVRLSYEATAVVLANASDTNSTGIIDVRMDSTTEHIQVEFYDDNGHYFQPEYPLHKLQTDVGNMNIAEILTETNEPWVIQIKGIAAGNTTIVLRLMVSGWSEFDSYPITINVLP